MKEKNNNNLTLEEVDILKEVGNICVGNSTSILSQLLGGAVDVHLPGLDLLSAKELSNYIKEKGKMVYGVHAQLSGCLEGTIFLLFPEKDLLKIIGKFLKDVEVEGAESIKFGISIIKEISGISIFSYINTLSSMIRKLITTSVPNFLSGSADELLNMIIREQEQLGSICIIHTTFKEKSMEIEGSYYLILNKISADILVDFMRNPV
ncbi:MAG: chemotaxis protein CheC [Candidatus Omnitrophica bacterium]|nr:chemotaxis protein CheC [Candidatus Omnitrophota bacterium]